MKSIEELEKDLEDIRLDLKDLHIAEREVETQIVFWKFNKERGFPLLGGTIVEVKARAENKKVLGIKRAVVHPEQHVSRGNQIRVEFLNSEGRNKGPIQYIDFNDIRMI